MFHFLPASATSFLIILAAWPIAAAVFTLPALVRRYRRDRRVIWRRIVPTYLFSLYLLGLVTFTLLPLPDDFAAYCAERVRPVHLAPFGTILGALSRDPRDVLQVVLNAVFFIPLGVFAGLQLGLSTARALLLGLAVSLLIEATQGTALWGAAPCRYRVADVDDLILNVSGVWLGRLLARLIPAGAAAPD